MEEKRHKGKKLLNVRHLGDILESHIEDIDLGYFWLEGEVQNLRNTKSHLYFSVVDGMQSIKCIIWDSIKTKNNIILDNGYKGKFMGKLNYYKNKNDISFLIYNVDLEGIGNMYNELEATKKYCTDKGFFDKEKKSTDSLKSILIITRFDSAAYNDIMHSLSDCYNIKVYVQDSFMQGENARNSIINNIDIAEKLSNKIDIDAIVLTRGGGSIDDLWVFNDRKIVERIYRCKVPFITAIGHDIDNSLCDMVADRAFITPTDFGKYINKLYSKKESISLLNEMRSQMAKILENKTKVANKTINEVTNDIQISSLMEIYDEKIDRLAYNKRLLINMVDTKLKNKILILERMRMEAQEYIHKISNIKLYKLDNRIITRPESIQTNQEFIMDFNGKKFAIKIIG